MTHQAVSGSLVSDIASRFATLRVTAALDFTVYSLDSTLYSNLISNSLIVRGKPRRQQFHRWTAILNFALTMLMPTYYLLRYKPNCLMTLFYTLTLKTLAL